MTPLDEEARRKMLAGAFAMPSVQTMVSRKSSITNAFVNSVIPSIPPTHEEIAKSLNLPKKKLAIIKKAIRVYNAAPQTDQAETGWSLDEMVMDGNSKSPDIEMVEADDLTHVLELLDKMDKFIKAVSTNAAAKAEMAEVGKDPSIGPDNWGSTVTAKCPKTVEVFKSAGLTPDEFGKAIFAMLAVMMSEDLAKSEDKTVKANADFLNANKDRAGAVFGGFMSLGEAPAATP